MSRGPVIAVTGATGFAGRSLLKRLGADGFTRIRALIRPGKSRARTSEGPIEWVEGELDSGRGLEQLVAGSDAVIHLAGLTSARHPSSFHRINAECTGHLVGLAQHSGVRHFIHISSLTALRPSVSPYARSKHDSETLALAHCSDMALTIIRAPAILGPDDHATIPLFRSLAAGFLPMPGGSAGGYRFSVIDVEDFAALLSGMAGEPAAGTRTMSPAGHLALGWNDILLSSQTVLGRRVRPVAVPPGVLRACGHAAGLAVRLGAAPQVFSEGKVAELLSGDWIGNELLANPLPLEGTLARCLAPFLASARDSGAYPARKLNQNED